MNADMVRYMLRLGKEAYSPVNYTKDFVSSRKFYKWVIKHRNISGFDIVKFQHSLPSITDVEMLEMWSMYKIEQEEV